MGKSKSPDVPDAPQFQPDPFVGKTQQGLFDTGDALRQGRFLDSGDPTVGFLNDLVSLNPEAAQRAIGLASRDVTERRDRAQQDVLNQLEANNQLTSSVTGNRLADLNEAFSSDIADISTNFYLADVERALGNTKELFGLGLNTLSDVRSGALENQAQTNQFALDNFGNQLAVSQLRSQDQRGGFGGALSGAIGGGLSGLTLSGGNPLGGLAGAAVGGTAGFLAPQGTGSALQSAGFGLSQTDQGLNAINRLKAQRTGGPIFGRTA